VVLFFGESNGSATVTPAGGNGTYTYLWDNGETTATANSLNVGIHGVTVTDAKECKITVSVTITEPTLLTASAVQERPVVCFGESNGSATVTLLVEMEHIPIYGTVKLRLRNSFKCRFTRCNCH
jgi:hypothetical protein